MTTKELIKQLKMIEKEHEGKEIEVEIGYIDEKEYKHGELILQNIMESNYD
jgi:hypothetical protein